MIKLSDLGLNMLTNNFCTLVPLIYCKISLAEKKLDIGWTWFAKSHQRSPLNTNCKLLLPNRCFAIGSKFCCRLQLFLAQEKSQLDGAVKQLQRTIG